MKITEKTIAKTVEHPLEDYLNIDAGTTIQTHTIRETELTVPDEYDTKDEELEQSFQDIHDMAITSYDRLQEDIEDSDIKYVPRMVEVSNQLLGTALDAAKQKARLKEHKDKILEKRRTSNDKGKNVPNNVTNNNVFFASREEMLESILNKSKSNDTITIEQIVEPKDNKNDEEK